MSSVAKNSEPICRPNFMKRKVIRIDTINHILITLHNIIYHQKNHIALRKQLVKRGIPIITDNPYNNYFNITAKQRDTSSQFQENYQS